jgi:hypothetical protein
MFGIHRTAEQKTAYRAAFTMGRIVDELWILIAIVWFVVFALWIEQLATPWNAVVAVAGLLALGALCHQFLPSLLRSTMPSELNSALPDDRFAGPASPRAPRTYGELVRRWLRRH